MSARSRAGIHGIVAAALLCAGITPTLVTAQTDAELKGLLESTADADEGGARTIDVTPLRPEGEAQEVRARSTSRVVEEIIVTAQKREENVQDVPISISAFSADALDARGLITVKDLALATPGLQFTELAGYTLIYLRGVGTDAFIPSADPSIATYVDGIYFPSAHSLGQSFGALERIEILKGPQGTLFGRNSTGGAINVITRKPDSQPLTEIQASYARFNDFKARIYTNIPLTDTLATSVSAIYHLADSYYSLDNPAGDELLDDITRGARVKLRWMPADDFEVTLTGMRAEQNGSTAALSVTTHPSPLATAAGVSAEQREYVATADSFPSIRVNTRALYGQIDWRLSPFDIKLLGSQYEVVTDDFQYDFDASSQPLVNFIGLPEFQEIRTAELQFTSNASSWASDRLEWVGGLYYLESEGGYDPAYLSLLNSVVRLPTQQLVSLIPQALIDLLGPAPAPSTVGLYFRGVLGTESYSAFLQGTYRFTDWLALTLGGRYQEEERSLLVSNVEIDNLAGGTTTLIPFAPRSSTEYNFSPRVSLDLRPADDLLTYLSYTRGFKSATYNIVNIYLPPDFVEPEVVTSYELGVKSELLGRKLRLNAAVFQTEIEDLQTASVSLTSGGAVNFENAGKARIRGAEFDATWVLMPRMNPGLVLTAGASWLDAIYTDYPDGNGFDETTGLNFESRDFSGNRIARTPDFTATIGLSQTIEMRRGSFEIGGDYYYNNGFFFLAQNSDVSFEPAYAILNARVSYLHAPWNLRVTLFGSNLTDERYNLQQFHTDFGRADALAPPISYGVRINWEF
jgi:iron complex outermembrane recepter protein